MMQNTIMSIERQPARFGKMVNWSKNGDTGRESGGHYCTWYSMSVSVGLGCVFGCLQRLYLERRNL